MNTPLYPQEAYFEQNNTRAFSGGEGFYPSSQPDAQQKSPLSALISSLLGSQQNISPIVPLLMKTLSGGNNESGDNPLAALITNIGNKKRPLEQGSEKEFPD